MKEYSDVHATQLQLGTHINTSRVLCRSALQAGDKSPHSVTAKALPADKVVLLGSGWGIKLVKK